MANIGLQEMKKPVNWGPIIAILVGILVPLTTFLWGLSQKVTAQGIDIESIKTEQYNNQIRADKNYDKLSDKMDKQQEKMEQIRVLLEQKQNRK